MPTRNFSIKATFGQLWSIYGFIIALLIRPFATLSAYYHLDIYFRGTEMGLGR